MDTHGLPHTWAGAECERLVVSAAQPPLPLRPRLSAVRTPSADASHALQLLQTNNLLMPEVKYEHCSFKGPPRLPLGLATRPHRLILLQPSLEK